jgi:hypothetical protein
MKRRTDTTAQNEPTTEAEWQEAVDAAYAAALIAAAVSFGLLEPGPRIDLSRCRQLLRRGKGLGFTPLKEEVMRIIAGLVRDPHPGFARMFAERLYERHRLTESGGIWIDA